MDHGEVEVVEDFGTDYFVPYQRALWDLFEKPQSSYSAKMISLLSTGKIIVKPNSSPKSKSQIQVPNPGPKSKSQILNSKSRGRGLTFLDLPINLVLLHAFFPL